MKKIKFYLKSLFKKLWGLPGAIIAAVITIGGLVQFGEYLEKYFPSVNSWFIKNGISILLTIVVILICISGILWWNCNKIRSRQISIDKSDKINKIVLFISPSPGGGGDFYQEHFSHLVKSAAKASNHILNIHITLICPHKDFGNEDPELLLSLANNYPAKLSGIFMIPAHPDKDTNLNGIIKFKERYPALVLLDVYPDLKNKKLPNPVNFIGGNENEGGALAALLAKRWFNKCNKEGLCRVLILKGRSTFWEMQRVNAFKASLMRHSDERENFLEISFEESEDLHYEMKKASKEIEARINQGQRFETFDLIFACNDEMAIGALEAVQNLVVTKRILPKKMPKIIGYDGTPEMKRLIKSHNPFLLGTVDVDIEEQAEKAISTMISLLNNPGLLEPEMCLLKPTLFINTLLLS